MGEFMAKCLPKYLATSASFLVIILGLAFLWFGLKPETELTPSPSPIAQQQDHLIIQATPIATSSATQGIEGEKAFVTKVVDGDTVEVGGDKTVRLIGIDTPETVDPRRPVGCFGKEASQETKRILLGKEIILQKDVSETDKYGRLLRYIFLPLDNGQMLFVNDYLVREGYATVYTFPPDVKFNEQLREAEREAKDNKRGLWGRC